MFAVSKTESSAHRVFSKKFRPYLQDLSPICFPVRNTPGKNGHSKIFLGESVSVPTNDTTYVMNHDAIHAASRAIEDLASGIGEGEIVSAFQKMNRFLPQKKRYIELARHLDAVRVWGEGIPPKNCPRIDFVPTFRDDINRYWMVLFESASTYAVIAGKQINSATEEKDKFYVAFLSFNPFIVKSIRRSFSIMSCGLEAIISRWEKEHNISSASVKELEKFLKKQAPAILTNRK